MKKKYVGLVIESYFANEEDVLIASDAPDNFIGDDWSEINS